MNPLLNIIISLATAAFFTWLLYATQNPWSKIVNYLLAALRFVAIALIVWMFFAPEQKLSNSYSEKPIIVFALDNSKSVVFNKSITYIDSLKIAIQKSAQNLSKNGFDIKIIDFKKDINIDSIPKLTFNQQNSNITSLLNSIQTVHDGQNLAGVLLVSDGIFNVGSSPLYENYTFPIYTFGIGDTTKRQDLAIKNIKYNRTVSRGNKFPIIAEIKNIGYSNQIVEVQLIQQNKIIETKKLYFSKNETLKEITFFPTTSDDKIIHYTLKILPLKAENTLENNIQQLYIEVIDTKTEILIIASSPHPDLKALQIALNQNEEYATTLFMPEISTWYNKKYDLVLFHNIPNATGIGNSYIEKIKKLEIPQWYLLGNQTNIVQLTQILNGFKITSGTQLDKVQADFSTSFEKFSFDQDLKQRFSDFPPISVPFGEYQLPSWETILYQKVGSIVTNKPILSVNTTQNPSQAIWIGEGLWQWRLIENQTNSNSFAFDKIILKTTQLLCAKKDKRKFRFSPLAQQFETNMPIQFETECLNDIYEKIIGNEISLRLISESKTKYDFRFTNTNATPVFETNGLQQGIYKYTANTFINNKEEITQGSFSISETDYEFLNTIADFDLLKKLSANTFAKYFDSHSLLQFEEYIKRNKKKAIFHYVAYYQEVININLLLLILLFLFFVEWAVRKVAGKQ